jgi:ABC-2 type transport system permease protein
MKTPSRRHRLLARFPNQLRVTLGLTKYTLIGVLRNPSAVVFGLLFPLAFVGIFGAFSNAGISKARIGLDADIAETNPVYISLQQLAEQEDSPIELRRANETDLRSDIAEDSLDLVIAATDAGKLTLVTSNTSQGGSQQATTIVREVVGAINVAATGQPPAITLDTEEISGKSVRIIDFTLPGQIGFSLISITTFGIAFPFLTLRRTLVLKRLFATSIKPMSFVVAQGLARSTQGIAQAAIIIGAGVWWFQFTITNGWIGFAEMLILAALGVMAFLGFGIFFSNVVREEQSLPIVLNLFNLPQFLLSGVFFSTEMLPGWVRVIGDNLPLSYLNNAMREVALNGAHLPELWPYLLGLLIWGAIAYVLAAKTFQQE